MIGQIIFAALFLAALYFFSRNFRNILKNIRLGRKEDRSDQASLRWKNMLLVAFGQRKMFKRPVPAILHLMVYLGFVIINIEMLEIIIDGLAGTHRVFSGMGKLYSVLIASFEYLAFLVLLGCFVFLLRRNLLRIKRFFGQEMGSWPKTDANLILITEILLMGAFLLMNAADQKLQALGVDPYVQAGSFPISAFLVSLLPQAADSLILIERGAWWFHIIGVLAFLNYLVISKHLHIILAFPNTYFADLHPKGKFQHLEHVHQEVKAMLDPSFTPQPVEENLRFGAQDVEDLSWKSLLDAYTCTECGRCTSVCPAHTTGKLLSPRKIMMDTRDRLEEVGKQKQDPAFQGDGKRLLDDYISREELWACTTCNACVEACPVNINPLRIIMELRQYAVMEESQAPAPINAMLGNIENNAAPWKYAQADRANWRDKAES